MINGDVMVDKDDDHPFKIHESMVIYLIISILSRGRVY